LPFAASLLAVGVAWAQYQIVGGHKLDANPMVGSGGVNTRVNASSGLTNTRYDSRYGQAQQRARTNSTSGIAQPTYWTQSSSSQTNPVGYQPPSRGQTYLTTRGPAYDSMATPLYKPNQYGARVEVGSSGSYMSVSQVGVVGTRYSPMR
jgi:hypothetical protein